MNPASVRRCVLYARLSISKEESVSIERQLLAGRKYAEGRGWQVVGEFVDDGVSATSNRPEERKGWQSLLAAGPFDAVVIWKVDRLARRVLDFLRVDEALQRRGAGLVAVEDPIDMTTPMGRAFATILAVFGEMEAAAISSRVKSARAYMVAEGRFAGGGVPYGYQSVPNPDGAGRVLAQDPDKWPWLARIVERAQRGDTVNSIATWLTAEHAPLPGRPRRSGETSWNRQTVDGILHNPILAGMIARNPGRKRSVNRVDPFAVVRGPDDEPVISEGLALLTVEAFTDLLRELDARTSPQARKKPDRQATSALLSRVVRCDDCGVYLYRGTNQKKAVLYCPRCRMTLSRSAFEPWLIGRLLEERGAQHLGEHTVADLWRAALTDTDRRTVLVSQLDTLRIRRGVVGRYFDEERVLLVWKPSAEVSQEEAA